MHGRMSSLLAFLLCLVGLTAPALCQTPCLTRPVPDNPPDSLDPGVADTLFARSNYISLLPERSDSQPSNVVMVMFKSSATHEQRQAAIHAVCGRVFGGALGYYYFVKVETDGTTSGLWRAIRLLRSRPGVEVADPLLPEVSPLRVP
jgi:hypothetical protein